MNCNKFKIAISAYSDNALKEQEKALLEQHIRTCAECAKEYEILIKEKHLLSGLDKQRAGAGFESAVMSKIKNKNFSTNPLESFIATAKTTLIASVFLFGIIAVFSFFTPSADMYSSKIDNVDAMNDYVLKGNIFAKHNKISEAKIMHELLG